MSEIYSKEYIKKNQSLTMRVRNELRERIEMIIGCSRVFTGKKVSKHNL